MKSYILFMLLVPILAFGQMKKDSLLLRECSQVLGKLDFMDYLRHETIKRISMQPSQGTEYDRQFESYFNNVILVNNPQPAIDIRAYLAPFGFSDMSSFSSYHEAVAKANAASLLEIYNRYGYLAGSQLKLCSANSRINLPIVFMEGANNKQKRKFRKIIKEAFRKNKIPKTEYDSCMLFLGELTFDEMLKNNPQIKEKIELNNQEK